MQVIMYFLKMSIDMHNLEPTLIYTLMQPYFLLSIYYYTLYSYMPLVERLLNHQLGNPNHCHLELVIQLCLYV